MRICVFLSSKEGLPDSYQQAARDVATWMGRNGHTLVYGGSHNGLMEILASTARKAGADVIGVAPQVLVDRNWLSDSCTTTFFTADLSDRKATFMRESNLFLALPGGIGTLDEVFTVLAARMLEGYRPRVVLYNVDHCWDTLLALLADLHARGVVSTSPEETVSVVSSVGELADIVAAEQS